MTKKILAAVIAVGVMAPATTAMAAFDVNLGGYFRGYGVYANNDIPDQQKYDFRRETKLTFDAKTKLDNGATIGVYSEGRLAIGNNLGQFSEIYAYFAHENGKVNLGVEDGAAYLLQVAAPSADSNIDGMRNYINAARQGLANGYAHADFGGSSNPTDRITYFTPKLSGFQAAASYAFQPGEVTDTAPMGPKKVVNEFKNLWEIAARYDHNYDGFDISLGAGLSGSSVKEAGVVAGDATNGIKTWNTGLNVEYDGFSLGTAYRATTKGQLSAALNDVDIKNTSWVIGASYDTGPWHVGTSYLYAREKIENVGKTDAAEKYTIGGVYTVGSGMSLRGAVALGNSGIGAAKVDYTQVTIGTDIQF